MLSREDGAMPRANRYFLPGQIWHITHRCHRKSFLLGFARDRRGYLNWLFEARKRFGLCVLNYVVTSNHVHLLLKDTGAGEIARSMQLSRDAPARSSISARIVKGHSGRIAITPRRLKATTMCTAAWSMST